MLVDPRSARPGLPTLLQIQNLTVLSKFSTFSVLKYLKSYLRSSTGEERLTGLALAYIHRDIDVEKTVDLIVDLLATKKRKIVL